MSTALRIVLASGSPRRKEILSQLGFEFTVHVSDVDESVFSGESPVEYVERVARLKAFAIVSRLPEQGPVIVLAADTIVVMDGEILGKPTSDEHSYEMISKLSGKTHEVYTSLVGIQGDKREAARTVVTEVQMRELPEAARRAYVRTGEGLDKAGAYAAQGLGAGLVREIRGSYTNVVGMPAAETIDVLSELGGVEVWPL